MRRTLIISQALLFWSAAQALPFGLNNIFHIEERHVAIESIERRHPQGLLDGLSSIGAEISNALTPPTPTPPPPPSPPTQTLNAGSAATRSSSDDDDDDDDETTSTRRSTATRTSSESTNTSTRRSTSTEESSSTTESSTSETSTTAEQTTTESTTATATPAEATSAAPTPEAPNNDNGNSVPTAGIAVGVVLGVALLAMIVFILFKWGPLAKWRENREYEKMMERSYRPALDDKLPMGFGGSGNSGLGLAPLGAHPVTAGADPVPPNGGYRGVRPTNNAASTSPTNLAPPQRAFSYTEDRGVSPEQERIKRKPLPTIGTGGGVQGQSPLMDVRTPTGTAAGTEPWLPGGGR